MKKTELVKLGNQVVSYYTNREIGNPESYSEELNTISFSNNLAIVIFIYEEEQFNVLYSSRNLNPLEEKEEEAKPTLDLQQIYEIIKGSFDYIVVNRDEVMIFGTKDTTTTPTVYFYVSSPLDENSIAYRINQRQLLITSIITILVGIIISFFFSNRLSKPITDLNEAAKKLSQGDFSVVFPDQGFTEVQELGHTLNLAKEELQITTQLQRELIANISHDLRTPLTLIKSYAEMIKDISGDVPAKREKHLDVIITETDRLTSLVTDVLRLSKIQSSTDELKIEPTNLSELCYETVKQFELSFSQNSILVDLQIEDDLYADIDRDKMNQVIYNFISNAITYAKTQIVVSLKLVKNIIRLDVIDDGQGIKLEEQDHIWERYYRSKENHQRTKAGSGLGLSIVKAILNAHGFEYGVISEFGQGSDFYFEITQKKE